MKILVDIGHPAQLHFFRNFIKIMPSRGHDILITAREKNELITLLKIYKIEYKHVGKYHRSNIIKLIDLFKNDYLLYRTARNFDPDIIIGAGSVNAAHVAALTRKPCVLFDDTEHNPIDKLLYLPFITLVCTPTSFSKNLGRKHIKYEGIDELAYLHPKYFQPDISILQRIGLNQTDRFIIVKFADWAALHDRGHGGFSFNNDQEMIDFIKELEKYGRVIISTEKNIPSALHNNFIDISPERMHDLLYFATMYIGEGGTMAAEAAVLGTPAILVTSIPTTGYLVELRDKYNLVHTCYGFEKTLNEAKSLLDHPALKKEWLLKKNKLLQDNKIDVTEFMVNLVENYPMNLVELKKQRHVQ